MRRTDPEPITAFKQILANPGTTALNQDDEHDHEKNSGDNPDNSYVFHVDSPFLSI
jgi:hypothetical protein